MQKQKITAAMGSFLFAVFLAAAYFITHTVPLTSIYLGEDRLTHAAVVFVFFLIAGFFFYLGQKKTRKKIIFYSLALVCSLGVPLLLFITQAGSFRGVEWALETFVISLVPVLFLLFGYLILLDKRIFALLVVICCTIFSLYHLVLLFRILPRMGKAFASAGGKDVIILLTIALFSFLCALASFKFFLASRR